MMQFAVRMAAGAACCVAGAGVFAQAYPSKPVRIVVPFAAGGPTDIYARFLGQRLQEPTAQSFVIENRPGAGSIIGTDLVAKSPADGYTWLFGTGQNTVNPSVMKKVPHDIVNDFIPVSLVYQSSFVLVVHPAVPAKSVKEFIALAKTQPNKLNFGSGGIGSAVSVAEMQVVILRSFPMRPLWTHSTAWLKSLSERNSLSVRVTRPSFFAVSASTTTFEFGSGPAPW